jgi:hypothetical protein
MLKTCGEDARLRARKNEYLKHDSEKGEPVFAGYEGETAFAPRSRWKRLFRNPTQPGGCEWSVNSILKRPGSTFLDVSRL